MSKSNSETVLQDANQALKQANESLIGNIGKLSQANKALVEANKKLSKAYDMLSQANARQAKVDELAETVKGIRIELDLKEELDMRMSMKSLIERTKIDNEYFHKADKLQLQGTDKRERETELDAEYQRQLAANQKAQSDLQAGDFEAVGAYLQAVRDTWGGWILLEQGSTLLGYL